MAITKPEVTDEWAFAAVGSPDIAIPTYFDTGFPAPAGVPVKPPRGFVNWLFQFCVRCVRYFCSVGLPEWDVNETEYVAGSIVRYTDGRYWVLVGSASVGVAPASDLTNWQLWLASPIAVAAAYNDRIWSWKNARQQEATFIDHLGRVDDRLIRWRESWRGNDVLSATGSSTFAETFQRWAATVVAGGSFGRVEVQNLSTFSGLPTPVLSRYLMLQIGSGAADVAQLVAEYQGGFHNDIAIAVDFDTFVEVGSSGQVAYTFGLGDQLADNTSLIGGVFEKKVGDATWFAVCGNGTALSTRVDTGVPVTSAGDRMRVEWLGSGVADNSVAAMRFYIGGFLVATITTNLPTAATLPRSTVILGAKRASGTTATNSFVGPVRYSATY